MALYKNYWSDAIWKLMYSIAYTFTEQDSKEIVNFYTSLGKLLPCPDCRKHYNEYINKHPIPILTDQLLLWINNLQNEVNVMNKRSIIKLDDQIKELDANNPSKVVRKSVVHINNSKPVVGIRKPGRQDRFHKAGCSKCKSKK